MQNAITRYGFKRASEFRANPLNWRRHPASQRSALSESLERLGFIAPVIENERSGLLIDGHERVQQALDAGDEQVPYVAVSLSDEDERLALATFDPIAAMAETDRDGLASLIGDIATPDHEQETVGNIALSEMLSELSGETNPFEEDDEPEDPPDTDEVDELVSMVKDEPEYRADSSRMAEQVIAHLAETLRRAIKTDADALSQAHAVIVSPDGRHDVLVMIDPKLHDIARELHRRHNDGESSPLDGLFSCLWDLSTGGGPQ